MICLKLAMINIIYNYIVLKWVVVLIYLLSVLWHHKFAFVLTVNVVRFDNPVIQYCF